MFNGPSKRQKELARLEHKKEKAAKLEERKRIHIKIADVDGPTAEVAEAPRN